MIQRSVPGLLGDVSRGGLGEGVLLTHLGSASDVLLSAQDLGPSGAPRDLSCRLSLRWSCKSFYEGQYLPSCGCSGWCWWLVLGAAQWLSAASATTANDVSLKY
jgi:hypothetical protein